jgi:hypothetical protein
MKTAPRLQVVTLDQSSANHASAPLQEHATFILGILLLVSTAVACTALMVRLTKTKKYNI